MDICHYDECTGCGACLNACPCRCIEMQEDSHGELHPHIDETKCVGCKKCIAACPNNNTVELHTPTTCLAAWIDDMPKRLLCASGGIGTIIAEHIVRDRHGIVFGTAYDDSLTPITTSAETMEGIEMFKGSKYVQSIVSPDTFRDIRRHLEQGRDVLYVATPCQIAGLKCFLKKDYDNLTTVDLLCHGVCPTKYFKEEIGYLCERHGISKATNVRFRGNDGNNYRLTIWDGDRRLYSGDSAHNYYMLGFMLSVSLRENCYKCKYAKPDRVADITIGDFIGLGTKTPFDHPKTNVSSITLNSPKGQKFFQEVQECTPTLRSFERDYEERLAYRPSLLEPTKRHKKNAKFRRLYPKYGFHKAMNRCFALNLLVSNVKASLKRFLKHCLSS